VRKLPLTVAQRAATCVPYARSRSSGREMRLAFIDDCDAARSHQQYLAKNPFGYRCHANTGVAFPETA
jgi:hypothetical protein